MIKSQLSNKVYGTNQDCTVVKTSGNETLVATFGVITLFLYCILL